MSTSSASQAMHLPSPTASTSQPSTSQSPEVLQDVGVLVNPALLDIRSSDIPGSGVTPLSSRELRPLRPLTLTLLEQPEVDETIDKQERLEAELNQFLKEMKNCDKECQEDSDTYDDDIGIVKNFFSTCPFPDLDWCAFW